MSIISKTFTFSAGATIIAAQHNTNFDTIYGDYNGNITNANISSGAAIVYSKLNLTGGIVNADISASGAIAASKLNLVSPGAIGTTTPAASKFTTLEATTTFKLGTTNQGDILYDNGTSIVRRTPGTSGQFLKTLGAAANPSWSDPGLSFASNTAVAAVTNTGDIAITNTNFYLVHAHFTNISAGGDTINILFNNDTGTVYKYAFDGRTSSGSLTGGSASAAAIVCTSAVNSTPIDMELKIFPQSGTGIINLIGRITYLDNAGGLVSIINFVGSYNNTIVATSFRILTSGVTTFTTGNVYLYKYGLS